jgi:hypothetical protein
MHCQQSKTDEPPESRRLAWNRVIDHGDDVDSIVIVGAGNVVNPSRETRAESMRHARNRIVSDNVCSMIFIEAEEGNHMTIVNQRREDS